MRNGQQIGQHQHLVCTVSRLLLLAVAGGALLLPWAPVWPLEAAHSRLQAGGGSGSTAITGGNLCHSVGGSAWRPQVPGRRVGVEVQFVCGVPDSVIGRMSYA